MKTFIQYFDDKFTNNLINTNTSTTMSGIINRNLYAIHYKYRFDSYIFCANLFDKEINQFILEFYQNTKIFIYYPQDINSDLVGLLSPYCTNIGYVIHENVKHIPILINDGIFKNQNLQRNNKLVCFIDSYTDIPEMLKNVLYPNTTLPIQLFGGKFKHHQNLNKTTETEKAYLLNTCEAYLSIDDTYLNEAVLCGAKIAKINDSTVSSYSAPAPKNYTTYSVFLEELIGGPQ